MAASCLGSFGVHNYAYSRHKGDIDHHFNNSDDTVWVTKRYVPTDLRATAPVPRHKLIAPDVRYIPKLPQEWIPAGQSSPYAFSRDREEARMNSGLPSTRCEEWSTLRQMLPSQGRPIRSVPPNWGTGFTHPPSNSFIGQKRFPHINSPMTRYVDDMHLTNRLFKLH